MTSVAKKIPYLTAVLFFSVAGFLTLFRGGEITTAVTRGMLAGFIAYVFAALLAYITFSEKIPEAKAPEGLEELEYQFRSKVGHK
ncbi:MAG: hypothetical protein HY280_10525 [Nitrospinae bacterium]|nr:hypothetical protein [Nitrospinota bacterium]